MTIPISFVLGVAASLLNAPAQTIVQERADVDLRGRVFALQLALGAAITIPPIIAVGLVGQVLNDMSRTMGVLAVVVVVAGILTGREWD
jgi:MFS family permease